MTTDLKGKIAKRDTSCDLFKQNMELLVMHVSCRYIIILLLNY